MLIIHLGHVCHYSQMLTTFFPFWIIGHVRKYLSWSTLYTILLNNKLGSSKCGSNNRSASTDSKPKCRRAVKQNKNKNRKRMRRREADQHLNSNHHLIMSDILNLHAPDSVFPQPSPCSNAFTYCPSRVKVTFQVVKC